MFTTHGFGWVLLLLFVEKNKKVNIKERKEKGGN